MVRLAVRIVMIALALVGLVTVAGWVWPAVRGASPAPTSLTFVGSPDGAFKAALATWSDGGAISPSCHDRVFVATQATAADQVVTEGNLVFEGQCGSFEPEGGRSLASPELSWREPRVLTIRFSTERTALMPATFRLRRLVAHGRVAVEFEVSH